MVNTARLRWAVLLVLIAVALVSSVVAVWRGGQTWGGLLLNLGSEMAGAVATYALLEIFVGGRERREAKKADLIAQLSSDVRDVAVPAAEELRRHGWLGDGSLRRADLQEANLQGANLTWATVANEQLTQAISLAGAILPDGTKHD